MISVAPGRPSPPPTRRTIFLFGSKPCLIFNAVISESDIGFLNLPFIKKGMTVTFSAGTPFFTASLFASSE